MACHCRAPAGAEWTPWVLLDFSAPRTMSPQRSCFLHKVPSLGFPTVAAQKWTEPVPTGPCRLPGSVRSEPFVSAVCALILLEKQAEAACCEDAVVASTLWRRGGIVPSRLQFLELPRGAVLQARVPCAAGHQGVAVPRSKPTGPCAAPGCCAFRTPPRPPLSPLQASASFVTG